MGDNNMPVVVNLGDNSNIRNSFLSFFMHIPCLQGASLGSTCFSRFPPSYCCYGGLLHLVILEMTPLVTSPSLGELLPFCSVLGGLLHLIFLEDSAHILLSRMIHLILCSSFLGDLPFCNIDEGLI